MAQTFSGIKIDRGKSASFISDKVDGVPLTVSGLSGQTADLVQFTSEDGTVLNRITSAGLSTTGGVFQVTYTKTGAGGLADIVFFTANRACKVIAAYERHGTAEATAGTLTGTLRKVTSGTAVGSGTAIMSNTFNLKGTADTNQTATLSATASDYTLAAGNSLGFDTSAAGTEIANMSVTVELQYT